MLRNNIYKSGIQKVAPTKLSTGSDIQKAEQKREEKKGQLDKVWSNKPGNGLSAVPALCSHNPDR